MIKTNNLFIAITIDDSDPIYCGDCQFIVYSDRGELPLCTLFNFSLYDEAHKEKRCQLCIDSFPMLYEDIGVRIKELTKPICHSCSLSCKEECPAYSFKGGD